MTGVHLPPSYTHTLTLTKKKSGLFLFFGLGLTTCLGFLCHFLSVWNEERDEIMS